MSCQNFNAVLASGYSFPKTSNRFYSPQDVMQVFNTADYVGNERLVFNIAHNKYRLIAKFRFHARAQRVYIRFIGTHAEYDKLTDIEHV